MWATAPSVAAHGGGGGGHGACRRRPCRCSHGVGPLRRPLRPRPSRPWVRAGAVRSEHYAGRRQGAAIAILTETSISGASRPGYRPFVLGGAQYYGYDSLPVGYQQVVLNGITYYLFDGVYYQPYIYGGQTVYLVTLHQADTIALIGRAWVLRHIGFFCLLLWG